MLHKLYQKQVEAWKERFPQFQNFEGALDTKIADDPQARTKLLLSRHKDTIELLEAEIERKRGMKKEYLWAEFNDDTGEHTIKEYDELSIYGGANVSSGYNKCLDEDIAYLEEQLTLLKNER